MRKTAIHLLMILLTAGAIISARAQDPGLTIIHYFGDGTVPTEDNVSNPYLIQASDGKFYGMTENGGSSGIGAVYRVAQDGTTTILHSFAGGATDGGYPLGGVIQGSDGNLYGVASYGGANFNGGDSGIAFKMTLQGSLTLLHSFGPSSLASPVGSLVQAGDGNFYGVTTDGQTTERAGAIFKMTSGPGSCVRLA